MNVYCIKHKEEKSYHAGLCIVTARSKNQALDLFSKTCLVLPSDLDKYNINIIENIYSTKTTPMVVCYSFE